MEYLAFVYTLLLVAICLMMAVLLARTSRLLKEPKDDEDAPDRRAGDEHHAGAGAGQPAAHP